MSTCRLWPGRLNAVVACELEVATVPQSGNSNRCAMMQPRWKKAERRMNSWNLSRMGRTSQYCCKLQVLSTWPTRCFREVGGTKDKGCIVPMIPTKRVFRSKFAGVLVQEIYMLRPHTLSLTKQRRRSTKWYSTQILRCCPRGTRMQVQGSFSRAAPHLGKVACQRCAVEARTCTFWVVDFIARFLFRSPRAPGRCRQWWGRELNSIYFAGIAEERRSEAEEVEDKYGAKPEICGRPGQGLEWVIHDYTGLL